MTTDDAFRVLLVEDSEDFAKELVRELAERGLTVEWVMSMRDALSAAKRLPYAEIIVLDLGLPDSKPEETIKQINELHEFSPVIVLTGYSHREIVDSILRVRATYVHKMDAFTRLLSFFAPTAAAWAQGEAARAERFRRIDEKLAKLQNLLPANVSTPR